MIPAMVRTVAVLILLTTPAAGEARQWQLLSSESFRVLHFDPAAAQQITAVAEALRQQLLARWAGPDRTPAWRPRCDLYLYPTNRDLVYMTGGKRKAGSAHALRSRLYRGRTLTRRINLARDDRRLLSATLPHELTHIIIQDLVPRVPLWANEGIAVSSEAAHHQRRYAALVSRHLTTGPLYPVKVVMTAHGYPERRYVHLFYAQSASLVRFFLGRGGTTRLIRFLDASRRAGDEAALRRIYGIAGYPDLQRRWLAFARRR